ncbi:MAG: BatD family protein [Muribaculaceae bacterium]|nr:BatD family protein [Muribaculaceae bacterium]
MRPRKKHILFLMMLMLFAMASEAATVRLDVQAGRGRREIGVGELFYITYEVSNSEKAPEKPASVPGGKVMYFDRTGQSSSFTSVNGKTTQSYSYTYTLTVRAQTEGSYTFGPVTVDGVKSNTVSYTIGAAAAASTPGGSNQQQQSSSDPTRHNSADGPKFIGKGDGNLYLKANVSKTTAYEQEALVYTVKLYTTYDAIKFIGATAAPKFEGFVVEESKDVSNQLDYETVGGKTYATAIIARYIIFHQMEGQLKVLGNTYTVSVDEREYYHDPFWGSMSVAKPLQLNVTPNDLTINVKSLPAPQPANFSGGVGKFSISSTLPAQTFLSNQAASVVYTVSGTGNLKYVKLPDLNALYPPQLEVYSPTPDVQTTVGRTNVSGTARFDYSFMPLESGSFKIPDVQLVYFNPESGQYETSTARGYEITVGRGKGSEKSQTRGNMSFNPNLLPVNGGLSMTHTPYVKRFGYWLFYIIPILLLLGAVGYYRAYLKANADLLAVRSRKADKMAKKRLRKAGVCIKKGEINRFYDEMLAALWGYMGDKLKMPPSELTRQNISEKLYDRGIPENVVAQFITLLDECEFAKYAPAATKGNMQPVYNQGVVVINSLEDSFKQQKTSGNEKS